MVDMDREGISLVRLEASREGVHLVWMLDMRHALRYYPPTPLGGWVRCTTTVTRIIIGQLQKWRLPHLCDSVSEVLGTSVGTVV